MYQMILHLPILNQNNGSFKFTEAFLDSSIFEQIGEEFKKCLGKLLSHTVVVDKTNIIFNNLPLFIKKM